MAAYLLGDLDGEEVTGGKILAYLNPQCGGSIAHCDVSEGTARDGTEVTDVVSDWTDLSLKSSEINAALGATEMPAFKGTYRYLRLVLCRANDGGAPTVRWSQPLMGSPRSVEWARCEVTSARLETMPLEITSSDTTTVEMVMDYSESVQVGAEAEGEDCTGSGNGRTCFSFPSFSFRAEESADEED